MQGIPPPRSDDAEDVVWALQTADTLWKRGERADAVVWLRRAAGAAGEAQDDDRAIELARLAGELTEMDEPPPPMAGPTPPPPPMVAMAAGPTAPPPPESVEVDIDVDLDSVRKLPSAAPTDRSVGQGPTVIPRPALSGAPKAASTPPRATSRPPPSASQAPDNNAGTAPFFPAPSRTPAEAAPVVPPLPPMRERAPSAAEVHAGMYDPWAENARASAETAAAAAADSAIPDPGPKVPDTARSAGAAPARESESPPSGEETDVLTSAVPSVSPSRAAVLDAAASEYEEEELSEAELMAASMPPPAMAPAPVLKKPPPLPPRARAASIPASEETSEATDVVREPVGAPAPGAPAELAAPAPGAPAELAAPAAEHVPEPEPSSAPLIPSADSDARGLMGLADLPEPEPSKPLQPSTPAVAAPPAVEAEESAAAATQAAAAPKAADDDLNLAKALETAPGISDLPDEDRAAFCATATVHSLSKDENLSQFALAFVLLGEFDVTAAIVDAPAARLGKHATLRSRGSTNENVAIKLIAVSDKACVATWSQEHVDNAFASCPWVEEDLRAAADRVLTLVGVTMGPLGERLDAALRDQVTDRLSIRSLLPGEVIVQKGKPVPGIIVIGVGEVELVNDDKVERVLASGEFLFPEAILGANTAPADARAGQGGALVMVGDRMLAQELLVTCPPLLEIFAGM